MFGAVHVVWISIHILDGLGITRPAAQRYLLNSRASPNSIRPSGWLTASNSPFNLEDSISVIVPIFQADRIYSCKVVDDRVLHRLPDLGPPYRFGLYPAQNARLVQLGRVIPL